jgi:allophanate hydrolase subunit 2
MIPESSWDVALRAGRSWPISLQPRYSNHPEVRVLPGPQWGQFTRDAQTTLLTGEYTMQPASDRVGLRLKGPALERKRTTEIISSGVTAGSIQVPNDGQPIVLIADRQTAGGYAQIAVVISADLPLLAQLAPAERVSFRRVTMEEAVAALREQRASETRWLR